MDRREAEGDGGQYKCGACFALFSSFEVQREHYKSEWHKFNLKRKVAGLPPATEKDFIEKMATPEPAKEPSKTKFPCSSCSKVFSSANAHQSHLRSKAHISNAKLDAERKGVGKKEVLSVKEDAPADEKVSHTQSEREEKEREVSVQEKGKEEENKVASSLPVLTPCHCLFCSKKHKNRESNLTHMATEHGLFIPDIEYLVDLSGFMDFLIEKVSKHYLCCYCKPEKQFASLAAAQDHMRSRDHCKIRYDTEDDMSEYDAFYDFSASYDAFLGRLRAGEEGAEREKEDGSEEEEGAKDDEKTVALVEESAKGKMRVSDAGHELIFANGKAVGHRQYMTYYRQRSKQTDNRDAIRIAKMVAEYRALGYSIPRNERQYVDKKIQREASKKYMQLGVKYNDMFVTRPQVMY